MGACDEDCSDLDLVVTTGAEEAGADRDADDEPSVEFNVKRSGDFTVRVEMYACSQNPCRYGVDVFGRKARN